jgi:uncharacterized 2Fe-2S/4Fe-4S cluster protein (DUF4445 family)
MQIHLQLDGTQCDLDVQSGQTILEVLQLNGITDIHAPCGGKGSCKKCTVFVIHSNQREAVLACQKVVEDGMAVELTSDVQLHITECGCCAIYPPDDTNEGYGIACDIGTTTVVCHLCNLKSGTRLATISGGNAQRMFGADVIARIQAAVEGRRSTLTAAIIDQLNSNIITLCQKTGVALSELRFMTVAGNTVMCHLFAGLAPDTIGVAPFKVLSLFGETMDAGMLGLCFSGGVYIAPAISGYVGGDITADVLSTKLLCAKEPVLLIDIGTNGEMVLGRSGKFLCCATAAGPTFEGAQIKLGMTASKGAISAVEYRNGDIVLTVIGDGTPIGICGSGLVDALAVMLELGAVDETGRLNNGQPSVSTPYLGEEQGETVFYLTVDKTVYVTQGDIRKIQLAKGAIAAGIFMLAEAYGIVMRDISRLVLAGGFGSFIRPASAARIGLFPPELILVTEAVGNAAGEGAVSALLSARARAQLSDIQNQSIYLELSTQKGFQDAYIDAMFF